MNENKAPTAASTTPLGNTREVKPTPLARNLSPHVREHLKNFSDANRHMREHLAKKKLQSGHARE